MTIAATTYQFDPRRQVLVVSDARLTRVLQRFPERCASLDDYARETSIETEKVLELLSPALDLGVLSLEVVGHSVFVHTAPMGRPTALNLPDVPPNLWERLREGRDGATAFELWKLVRGLSQAGWRVEPNVRQLQFGLSRLPFVPMLGVYVQQALLPLILHPQPQHLADPGGPLSIYEEAGAVTVGVVCDSGGLAAIVTAARQWAASQPSGKGAVGVVVLESPSFAPTLVTSQDAAVRPRSVSQSMLDNR